MVTGRATVDFLSTDGTVFVLHFTFTFYGVLRCFTFFILLNLFVVLVLYHGITNPNISIHCSGVAAMPLVL